MSGAPPQFFYRFNDPFAEENSPFVVIFVKFVLLIKKDGLAVEIIFVVDKINL